VVHALETGIERYVVNGLRRSILDTPTSHLLGGCLQEAPFSAHELDWCNSA
jgi:hypothetical protein